MVVQKQQRNRLNDTYLRARRKCQIASKTHRKDKTKKPPAGLLLQEENVVCKGDSLIKISAGRDLQARSNPLLRWGQSQGLHPRSQERRRAAILTEELRFHCRSNRAAQGRNSYHDGFRADPEYLPPFLKLSWDNKNIAGGANSVKTTRVSCQQSARRIKNGESRNHGIVLVGRDL